MTETDAKVLFRSALLIMVVISLCITLINCQGLNRTYGAPLPATHPERAPLHPAMELQVAAKLRSYGYTVNNPAQLRRAVLHWQKANGLIVDGIVGPQTMASLHVSAAPVPAPAPARHKRPPAQAPSVQATTAPRPGVDQWHDVAISVGWPEELWPSVACIIHGESRGIPTVVNSIGATGLMQILARYYHGVDLKDPAVNLATGWALYQSRGWQPWTGEPCF